MNWCFREADESSNPFWYAQWYGDVHLCVWLEVYESGAVRFSCGYYANAGDFYYNFEYVRGGFTWKFQAQRAAEEWSFGKNPEDLI